MGRSAAVLLGLHVAAAAYPCVALLQGAMSSEAIARVLALFQKAEDLEDKGHLLRSAEYYSRAAEAARSLDPRDDNFVTLDMQRRQAVVLGCYCADVLDSKAVVDLGLLASCRAKAVALFTAVTAALERRRLTDTLLEGKCTAAEEAWYYDAFLLTNDESSPAEAAGKQKLVGYHTYLYAASHVFNLHTRTLERKCSATQLDSFAQLVVHAMDLMQQMRHNLNHVPGEVSFAYMLSTNMPVLGSQGLDPRRVRLLTDAWRRLQQSGVLEQRSLVDERVRLELSAIYEKNQEASKSAILAPDLRSCGMASCGAREAHPQHFKACAACRTVVYCCREHQVADWPVHKAACKAARKTTAASDKDADAGR